MIQCKICIPDNYIPNLDEFYDSAQDMKSLNKRFKKYISTVLGMYSFYS